MASVSILSQLTPFRRTIHASPYANGRQRAPDLHTLWLHPGLLPHFVQDSAVAQRYLHLLGPLAWGQFPERDLQRNWGQPTLPFAAFAAACLVKIDQQMTTFVQLRRYLGEHPALLWLLGFPLVPSRSAPWRFAVEQSLPTHRHFTRLLHAMPNDSLQFLLSCTVTLLQQELQDISPPFGESVSLDTKHIIAWVKENNPKAYVSDRYDKAKQPPGDLDCRLGCKRRHNQSTAKRSSEGPPPTPTKNPLPADTIEVGEYYWGYASGVVATKVPGWGEYVLAEFTQPFDCSDVSYFYPLLAATEQRLGFRPRFAALDAAFDAFYVYEYFHRPGEIGFAAVPFSERGGHKLSFDSKGLPLCQAGLAMPLRYTFICKTTLFAHQRGRHACPLLYPHQTGQSCPVGHSRWAKGGCTTTLPTSIGTRIRYQLDRASEAYQQAYRQRSATERINSQAVALGIERPHLRNGAAIANLNTLIYVLINLRALQRLRVQKAGT